MTASDLSLRLDTARRFDRSGQVLQAESLYLGILKESPRNVEAARRLAHFALTRGDATRAIALMQAAVDAEPQNAQLRVDLAVAHLSTDRTAEAIATLERR